MARCGAIKANGERCKGIAGRGSEWCPAHDPARAEQRRRAASKAARSRPGKEVASIKSEIRSLIEGLLSGKLDKGVGAVALQGYNTLLRAVEVGQRTDLDELVRKVEEMERGDERGVA